MGLTISIEGTEGLISKLEQYTQGEKIKKALTAAAEVVRDDAVENAPVDSGRLAGSITTTVEDTTALIGPTAEYGIYVEFGTGALGDSSVAHTTKKYWRYKKGGRWYTTSGQKPQPFMVPALKNNVSEIAAKFREVYAE